MRQCRDRGYVQQARPKQSASRNNGSDRRRTAAGSSAKWRRGGEGHGRGSCHRPSVRHTELLHTLVPLGVGAPTSPPSEHPPRPPTPRTLVLVKQEAIRDPAPAALHAQVPADARVAGPDNDRVRVRRRGAVHDLRARLVRVLPGGTVVPWVAGVGVGGRGGGGYEDAEGALVVGWRGGRRGGGELEGAWKIDSKICQNVSNFWPGIQICDTLTMILLAELLPALSTRVARVVLLVPCNPKHMLSAQAIGWKSTGNGLPVF